MELAIGIPIILEIVLPLEGVFGMNLDSSAQGELASGHQVLESMVKADTSVASNWAVVIQTSFRPELVLLGFTFNFPISTKSQVLVRAGSSIIPDMYLSSMLYHATSLSELMGGLPDLGPVCDMDFLPKEVTSLRLTLVLVCLKQNHTPKRMIEENTHGQYRSPGRSFETYIPIIFVAFAHANCSFFEHLEQISFCAGILGLR